MQRPQQRLARASQRRPINLPAQQRSNIQRTPSRVHCRVLPVQIGLKPHTEIFVCNCDKLQQIDTDKRLGQVPWFCTAYMNEVKSSDSVTLAALKFFLTANDN